ncbi:hypothetical protein AYO20_07054 [Fonsecaea nubica]|uniref:Uncharacterized protein n=1 Tax=Fonsecaea nubica TaxID=856822 RepID=A0A178CWA2_9EURO|nr:hypothetical protein AYO20_07054 [Fonsecaea nubica]OAL33716.1 hypothetical protein AYO20_07054 [Fonsecaea nubica]
MNPQSMTTATTATPAAPIHRPDIKGRSVSDESHYAITPTRTLSPTTTLSPLSTESLSPTAKAPFSFPFHFTRTRSRSKSPRPPPIDVSIPSPATITTTPTNLKHVQTSPLPAPSPSSPQDHARTQKRHTSDSAISPSTMSPPTSPDLQKRDHGWIQKKSRHSGSSPGGYGRHSDDWLFGGISLTQTAREIVTRGKGRGRKEEDEDAVAATGTR